MNKSEAAKGDFSSVFLFLLLLLFVFAPLSVLAKMTGDVGVVTSTLIGVVYVFLLGKKYFTDRVDDFFDEMSRLTARTLVAILPIYLCVCALV